MKKTKEGWVLKKWKFNWVWGEADVPKLHKNSPGIGQKDSYWAKVRITIEDIKDG